MSKDAINQYDATAANNTDVGGISIDEGMLPSNVNNALREIMSHLKDVDAGTSSLTSPVISGDLTVDTSTLKVDSTNNQVGIGTASPNSYTGFTVLTLNNATNGAEIDFEKNGTVQGSIFTPASADDFTIAAAHASGDLIFQAGGFTERARILSGGGLTFNGDTAAANALDDYEEGTWTPVVAAGWSSPSYAYQNGNYQKVGNVVEAFFFIQFSSSTSEGAHVRITGLPFTSVNETGGAMRGGALTYFTTPVDAPGMVLAYVFHNATEFRLYAGNDGGASAVSNGAASLSFLIGSVVYRVS